MKTFRTALILAIAMFVLKVVFNSTPDSYPNENTDNIINQIPDIKYNKSDNLSLLDDNFSKNNSFDANNSLKSKKKKIFIKMKIVDKKIHFTPPWLDINIHTNRHSQYFDDKRFFQIATKAIVMTMCNSEESVFSMSKRPYIILHISNGIYSKTVKINQTICNNLDLSLLSDVTDNYEIILKPNE